MDIATVYTRGVRKKFNNYFATWFPNSKIELGDIGILRGAHFDRITSLKHLDVEFTVRKGSGYSPIEYASESGIQLINKLEVDAKDSQANLASSNSGLEISFSKKGAFVFQAENSRIISIDNIDKLGSDIITAYQKKKWEFNWMIVTSLVYTPVASIIISKSSNSNLVVTSKNKLGAGVSDLGKANLEFGVQSQKGDVLHFIGAKNLTPFFQLRCLKRRIIRPTNLGLRNTQNNSTSSTVLKTKDQFNNETLVLFDIFNEGLHDHDYEP